MYNQLTLQHSLYIIDEQLLHDFRTIAEQTSLTDDVTAALSHNALDNFAVVLQIWCLLVSEERNIYLNFEKSMAYSCNFFSLNLLRNDAKIKQFIKVHSLNEQTKYVLAYHLAVAMLQWVDQLLLGHKNGQELMKTNLERDYFLLSDAEPLTTNDTHELYVQQKFMTHLLASSVSQSSLYHELIEDALRNVRHYLQQQALHPL